MTGAAETIKEWRASVGGLEIAGLMRSAIDSTSEQTPNLLLHGWLDNAASMLPMFDACPGAALAIDLPGHGHSAHTARDHHAPFVDYLDCVLGTLDALQWTKVNLIGHSMGGAIAMLFASAFPERVQALVMIDVLGPVTGDPAQFGADLRRGLAARRTVWNKQLPVYADIDAAIAAREGSFGIPADAARPIVERGLRAVDGGFSWRTDPRLMTPSPTRFYEPQVLQAISQLTTPTMIFLATPRTMFLNDAKQQLRKETYQNADIIELPGVHHLHWVQSDAMTKMIKVCLAS